jgi:drug/metabolite transporter (DMT)-like permease
VNDATIFAKDDTRPVVTGSLFVLIAAFGFSAKAILIKLAYAAGAVDAISLLTLRMAMSLPFFLTAAFWIASGDQRPSMTRSDWLHVIVLGIIGYYLASLLDFKGLAYISAGLERLILFLYPTLVVLLSAIVLRKPVSYPEILALVFSYAGIGLVVANDLGEQSGELWIGIGLVFGSAVAFALYMMGSGVVIRRIGSFRFTCYSMIVACLVTTIHCGLQPESRVLGLPLKVYGLALVMALLSTVLPAFLMNAGIRRLGSGTASIISSVGPVVTLGLAYFLLDERLSPFQAAGAALVLLGILTITRLSARSEP